MRIRTGNGGQRIIAFATGVSLIALALAGCGGDDNGDDSQASATVPAPEVTVGPPGIIDGSTYISTARHYKMDFPEGWSPDENYVIDPSFGVDAFFAPEQVQGVSPNISVRCDFDKEGAITQESFIDISRQKAQRFAYQDVAESATTLGGEPAVKLVYEIEANADVRVKKTDVVYAGHGCAWTVTLTNATNDDNYAALFDKALGTFAFIQDPGSS